MNLQTTNNETKPHFLQNKAQIHFTYLGDFTDHFIKQITKGIILTDKGVKYSESTVRQYKMFREHLTNYETIIKHTFSFAELNVKFADAFKNYLISLNLTKNSIALVLSKFKSVMKFAFYEGYSIWNGSGIKTTNERTTKIFLSIPEITKLHQSTNSETKKRVLDIFTIQCFTGMRYDTLCKFLRSPLTYIKEEEGFSYIDIIADKTNEQSVIPLGETVVSILKKHNGNLQPFTEEYVNREIKVIAKEAGLDNNIAVRITKGNKMTEELHPKWKLVTTHTARRSFTTNILRSIKDKEAVASMTGHSSTSQLDNYNRSEKLDRVMPYLDNDFFSTQISQSTNSETKGL